MVFMRRVSARLPSSRHKIRGCREAPGDVFEGGELNRPTLNFFVRTALSLLALICLGACQSTITRRVSEPATPLSVRGVVVYPVRLSGSAPAHGWRAFELGQRLVQVGLDAHGTELALFGPSEFAVSRWDDDSWRSSTAGPVVLREGLRLDEVLVLRAAAEQRVAEGSLARQRADGSEGGGLTTREETWLCDVWLLRPTTQETLAAFHSQLTVDPFARTGEEDYDADAALTHRLEAMARLAYARAATFRAPDARRAATLPLGLALTPAVTWAAGDTPRGDALSAEVWLQGRARFLTPGLGDDEVVPLSRLPEGMLVTAAPAGAGVEAHDVVLRVADGPALPQVLLRRRLAGPVQVVVRRAGRPLAVTVP